MKTNWKILKPKLSSLSRLPVSKVVKTLLVNRGIDNVKIAKKFLNPSLDDLYDPYLMRGMEDAVERILKAVENGDKIFIYGDYDVDGVCATAILWEFLYKELGADVLPYIPHRVDEGYGLNEDSIQKLVDNGAQLIISVDCGIRNAEIVDKFKDRVDFLITDHHEIGEVIPDTIVIHSRHPEGKYPFGEISGGVTSWKLVNAIRKKLGRDSEEEMLKGVDLAALSTVCDVMPLSDENRVIVKFGLEQMRSNERIGLDQMMDEAGISKEEIDAYHLGFILGPRINATGRLDHALDAVRLLVTENAGQAGELAQRLGSLNRERQELTAQVLKQAEAQVLEFGIEHKLLFAYGENWPEGIVGIVAGRLTDKYHKPTLVASLNGDEAKGSARSIAAFHITEAMEKLSEKLMKFGGHAQAAGFTLRKDNIEGFRDSLLVLANEMLDEEDLIGKIEIDMELPFGQINMELAEEIAQLEPYGYGNKKPVFLTQKVKIASVRPIGKTGDHVKLIGFKDGVEVDCIGFRMGERLDELEVGKEVGLVYNLDINEWNGRRSVQLKLKDIDS